MTTGGSNNDFKDNPTWRIFRIMSEFVEGFSFISSYAKSVTVFGSARLKAGHPAYEMARDLGSQLVKHGFTVVTGGGPGIMEAANRGAHEANGDSVGLNIVLPFEQKSNDYVKRVQYFHYFFSRKVMLSFSAEAYVFLPGGFGTLDEFFEIITLVQTGKIEERVPVVVIGRDFWEPLFLWLEQTLLKKYATISADDLKLVKVVDSASEAVEIITGYYAAQALAGMVPQDRAAEGLKRATEA